MTLIILSTIAGYYLSKVYLVSQSRIKYKSENVYQYLLKIAMPFSEIRSKTDIKVLLVELLGALSLFIFVGGIYEESMFGEYGTILESLIYIILISLVVCTLLYQAVSDIYTYEVSADSTASLVIMIIASNVLIGLTRVSLEILFNLDGSQFMSFTKMGTLEALFGLILGYTLVWLLIRFFGEKYIGRGDADILAIIGGSLGILGLLVAIFISSILGSIIGGMYSIRKKKFKGVIIPMVPFLLLGYLIAFGYTDLIIDFLLPV